MRQLRFAQPVEIAVGRAGGGVGQARVIAERVLALFALLDRSDDLLRLVEHFLRAIGVGLQIDFADVIFGRALLLLQLLDDRIDLFVADIDVDLAPQIAVPRKLGLDLALQRTLGRADPAQIDAHLGDRLAEVARDGLIALVDLVGCQLDLGGLGLLDLQRFVDQLPRDQQLVLRHFLGRQLQVARCHQQGDALVDVGAGDHRAVDDRGWLADVGIDLAENLQVLRNVEPHGGRRIVGNGLRDRTAAGRNKRDERGTERQTAAERSQAGGGCAGLLGDVSLHVVKIPSRAVCVSAQPNEPLERSVQQTA
ncbi:hypothetical protein D9M73_112900 [compost metagenome]